MGSVKRDTVNFTPVKSAARVFDILEEVKQFEDGILIHELGKNLGIAKSSIHNLVHTMLDRGYLFMNSSRKIQIGYKFLEFYHSLPENPLIPISKMVMQSVNKKVNENVHLAILDGTNALFIAYEETTKPIQYRITIGTKEEAHLTGVGKVLLSQYPDAVIKEIYKDYPFSKKTSTSIMSVEELVQSLQTTRTLGYAIDNEESQSMAKCFAAPIVNNQGKMLASVSISIPFFRIEDHDEEKLIELVIQAGKDISFSLQKLAHQP